MTRFVLATANPAKAREIKEVIQTEYEDIEVIPLDPSWPEVIEDGATLEANATKSRCRYGPGAHPRFGR